MGHLKRARPSRLVTAAQTPLESLYRRLALELVTPVAPVLDLDPAALAGAVAASPALRDHAAVAIMRAQSWRTSKSSADAVMRSAMEGAGTECPWAIRLGNPQVARRE